MPNSASLAHFTLCGGSYFLGVATAIGLVYFDALPDDWKFQVTVAVAVMAIVLLSVGVVQLMREPRADARVHSRGHDFAASRGTAQMVADWANPPADGPTVVEERPAARPSARSPSFEPGISMHAAPRSPLHPDRGDGVDARNAAGIRRDADAFDDDAASRSAAGESTHDIGPPERSGSVPGVGTSPPDHLALPPTVGTEPEPAVELQPAGLIGAWDAYRRAGDGHFNPCGLQRVLDDRDIGATVKGGDRIAAGGSVLIVETPSRETHFYVLPSFAKSPRAVADWFDDNSGGALTGRTERVLQIAEGRWTEPGFEVVRRGEVA